MRVARRSVGGVPSDRSTVVCGIGDTLVPGNNAMRPFFALLDCAMVSRQT
jgi:hypothetical protein